MVKSAPKPNHKISSLILHLIYQTLGEACRGHLNGYKEGL